MMNPMSSMPVSVNGMTMYVDDILLGGARDRGHQGGAQHDPGGVAGAGAAEEGGGHVGGEGEAQEIQEAG